jgi:hypothetical protein
MKKILILFFVVSSTFGAFAIDPEFKETTSFTSHSHYSSGHGSGFSFRLDFGLNNYLENGQFPDANNSIYSVKPWGSWNVFLGLDKKSRLAGPLYFNYGTGVSWYNFKFDNASTRIFKENDGVLFQTEPDPDVRSIKSKLTAAYLDVFLVPTLYFGKDRYSNSDFFDFNKNNGLRIGFGGYAGYKLNSYSKYVYKVTRHEQRDKFRSGYFLENFRYGAKFQIGVNGLDFYANYDLNELFMPNRGPKLNAFSFGIIL